MMIATSWRSRSQRASVSPSSPGRRTSSSAREREPVLAGQAHVEQHEIRQVGGERLAHRRAVRGLRDLVAVGGEVVGDGLADLAVVLDEQYATAFGHGEGDSSVHGSRKASIA